MKRRKLILFFLLVAAVLACTSSLIEAEADDTYNFYFQKAPGPTVVNQGGAGPTNPKDVIVNPEAAVVNQGTQPASAAATPATVAQAAEIDEPSSTVKKVELSFGISGSSSTSRNTPWYAQGEVISGQYLLGLQLNLGRYVGLQAEGFYLVGNSNSTWNSNTLSGSRLDYSGALVITPLRLQPAGWMRISMSVLGGGMTVPLDGYDPYGFPAIEHKPTLFYGARVGFELWNTVALQATVKRFEKYDVPNGTLALAFLL